MAIVPIRLVLQVSNARRAQEEGGDVAVADHEGQGARGGEEG